MSLTIRHKYKHFHSTVQRAKDRRQKFHFCRLPFDVRPLNVRLNLSNINKTTLKLFPENTQDFSFNQPQTGCQHTVYSPTLLVSGWLAFGP